MVEEKKERDREVRIKKEWMNGNNHCANIRKGVYCVCVCGVWLVNCVAQYRVDILSVKNSSLF